MSCVFHDNIVEEQSFEMVTVAFPKFKQESERRSQDLLG
jgi:hypothetical protein